jgi:hypothetical protein
MLLRICLFSLGLAFVLLSSAVGYDTINFNDGGYHRIDYTIDGKVYIDQYNPGTGTQVEVVDNGGIAPGQGYGSIYAYNDSQLTVSGGNIGWSLDAGDRSKVKLTNGYVVSEFSSWSINRALMSGGSVWGTTAFGAGSFDISGGTIR